MRYIYNRDIDHKKSGVDITSLDFED
jgi:hypothetical protein